MAGRQGGSAGGEQRRSAEVTGAVTSSDSTAHTVAGSPRDMEQDKARDQLFSRKRSFTFGAYGGVDKFICPAVNCRPETFEHSILDILDSPTSENKSLLSGNLSQKASDLFEIIEKLQGSRLDEQRCEFPPPFKFLKIGGPLPLVLPPKAGGYWIEPPPCCEGAPPPPGPETEPGPCDIMDRDPSATLYRDSFRHKFHQSFTAVDPSLGSLILSVRVDEEDSVHVILRMKECSLHGVFHLSLFPEFPSAGQLAKLLCDSVTVSKFEAVSYPKAPELIAAFDEHRISENFKFGVLYQREGQVGMFLHALVFSMTVTVSPKCVVCLYLLLLPGGAQHHSSSGAASCEEWMGPNPSKLAAKMDAERASSVLTGQQHSRQERADRETATPGGQRDGSLEGWASAGQVHRAPDGADRGLSLTVCFLVSLSLTVCLLVSLSLTVCFLVSLSLTVCFLLEPELRRSAALLITDTPRYHLTVPHLD
ncbi:rap1 GTPase-activating protein 2-like [Lepisosteus oculatus]|uniref:rap1 GTPase-activating protein 2-like n=1 Tax=Lepisosteus oculatus TaxID=7918 RepID=UPI003715F7DD